MPGRVDLPDLPCIHCNQPLQAASIKGELIFLHVHSGTAKCFFPPGCEPKAWPCNFAAAQRLYDEGVKREQA